AKTARTGGGQPAPLRALFLGGGTYSFPRYLQARHRGSQVDVAEIDPAVTRANHMALGLPRDTTIRTYFRDPRRFVDQQPATQRYDMILGDAFNNFSIPSHLTTREFNDRLPRMLPP